MNNNVVLEGSLNASENQQNHNCKFFLYFRFDFSLNRRNVRYVVKLDLCFDYFFRLNLKYEFFRFSNISSLNR